MMELEERITELSQLILRETDHIMLSDAPYTQAQIDFATGLRAQLRADPSFLSSSFEIPAWFKLSRDGVRRLRVIYGVG